MTTSGDFLTTQSDGWFRADEALSNYTEVMTGGWWEEELSPLSFAYVNASGSNTYPYDTPEKGAINFGTLFSTASFVDGAIIEVVAAGDIDDTGIPDSIVLQNTLTIRSWSGNLGTPIVKLPNTLALAYTDFFHVDNTVIGRDISLEIHDVEFIGVGNTDFLQFQSTTGSLTVYGCDFETMRTVIRVLDADTVNVHNNRFYDISDGCVNGISIVSLNVYDNTAIKVYNFVFLNPCTNVIIEKNTVFRYSWIAISIAATVSLIIRSNRLLNISFNDTGAIYVYELLGQIYNNYIFTGTYGILSVSSAEDSDILNNTIISEKVDKCGIFLNTAVNTNIINNCIRTNSDGILIYSSYDSGVVDYNNIYGCSLDPCPYADNFSPYGIVGSIYPGPHSLSVDALLSCPKRLLDIVVAATTDPITIATDLNSGDTIDSVSLNDGDRVLVKNQVDATENGVYIVGAVPARASDFDTGLPGAGAYCFVIEGGIINAQTGWVCNSIEGSDIIGTDTISFELHDLTELPILNKYSPCIDSGASSTVLATIPTVDIRDEIRPIVNTYYDTVTDGTDIGCIEATQVEAEIFPSEYFVSVVGTDEYPYNSPVTAATSFSKMFNNWYPKASVVPWEDICMSSEGSRITAVDTSYIYVSEDFGKTWIRKDGTTPVSFDRSVAMSKNGSRQTTVLDGDRIYISIDFGNTWVVKPIPGDLARYWRGVAVSDDGSYQIAVSNPDNEIYVSSDYGENWAVKGYSKPYTAVAVSGDGRYQTAVTNLEFIYISSDFGESWSATGPSTYWRAVTMSNDGQYQTAVEDNGSIFRSTDYGTSWFPVVISDFSWRPWTDVSMSSDGRVQVACDVSGYVFGYIWASYDYGETWTALYGAKDWSTICISSDTGIIAAGALSDYIYLYKNPLMFPTMRFIAGDIINVINDGEIDESSYTTFAIARDITIKSWYFNANRPVIKLKNDGALFQFYGNASPVINDLRFYKSGPNGLYHYIVITSGIKQAPVISGCEFFYTTPGFLLVTSEDSAVYVTGGVVLGTNMIIENNTCSQQKNCIRIAGDLSDLIVRRNLLSPNTDAGGPGINLLSGILSDSVVEKNIFEQAVIGIQLTIGNNTLIQKNRFFNYSSRCIICDSLENNSVIVNNIFENTSVFCINIITISNSDIVNNTFYGTSSAIISDTINNGNIVNNLIQGNGNPGDSVLQVLTSYNSGLLDYNNAYLCDTPYLIAGGAVSPGPHSTTYDPELYTLIGKTLLLLYPTSRCIDAGIGSDVISSVPMDDFRDGVRPIVIPGHTEVDNGTDIGAVEDTGREAGIYPSTFFVNASGSGIIPYDTPAKGSTTVQTLIQGMFPPTPDVDIYPNDIIEVVDDGTVTESIGVYNFPFGVIVRSWSGNFSKPTIKFPRTAAFYICQRDRFRNLKFLKDFSESTVGYSSTDILANNGKNSEISGCEFKIIGYPEFVTRTSGILDDLYSVVSDGSTLVAVGDKIIIYSTDNGTTWNIPPDFSSSRIYYSVKHNGSYFLTVASGGEILTSADGISWFLSASGTLADLRGVVWDQTNSQWIVVGAGGAVLTSPDASVWTPQVSGTLENLNAITFIGIPILIAVGDNGTMISSSDGILWTPLISGTAENLYSISNSQFVAAGANGTIVYSLDAGSTWIARTEGTKDLYDVSSFGLFSFFSGETGTVLIMSGIFSGKIISLSTGTTENLRGAFNINNQTFIAGDNGIILSRYFNIIGVPSVTVTGENAVVENNVLINCATLQILNCPNSVIANNTINGLAATLISFERALLISPPLNGTVVLNNILSSDNGLGTAIYAGDVGLIQDYNCINNVNLEYDGAAVSGPHNIDSINTPGNTDPQFVNPGAYNLELLPSSPCIESAASRLVYPMLPSRDFRDAVRPVENSDIGAYEMPTSGYDFRYWVSPALSNWNNVANWSTVSGGPGGASVPDSSKIVVFDTNGVGSCQIDAQVSVKGLFEYFGYPGRVSQNSNEIVIDTIGGFFDGGSFDGTNSDIRVRGDLYIGNCDFTSTDRTLSCDQTFISMVSNNFSHHNGVVSLDATGCALITPDMTMSTLQLNAPAIIGARCYTHDTILKAGVVRKGTSDTTVHVRKDLYALSGYNQWSVYNNLPILIDGTAKQELMNEYGCIIPSLFVDKTTSLYVTCHGESPVRIKGDFILTDGTFNSNGLSLQVGI